MAAVKMNLSMDARAAALLRRRAAEQSKPIGRYVSDLVDADARRAEDALAEEGYRVLAHDLSTFAELTVHLEDDTWPESQ